MISEHCVSDHMLDRFFANELSPQVHALTQSHLNVCHRCQLAHRAIVEGAQSFGRDAPSFEQLVGDRRPSPSHWGAWVGVAAMLLVALGVTWWIATHSDLQHVEERIATVRSKGRTVDVSYFSKRSAAVTSVVSGSRIAAGDRVAAHLRLRTTSHIAWYGRDPQGVQIRYYPATAPSAKLPPGEHELPVSIEFDDAPGVETLLLVVCQVALLPTAVGDDLVDSAQRQGCIVDTLNLRKAVP